MSFNWSNKKGPVIPGPFLQPISTVNYLFLWLEQNFDFPAAVFLQFFPALVFEAHFTFLTFVAFFAFAAMFPPF
jgi:hypothetical protein